MKLSLYSFVSLLAACCLPAALSLHAQTFQEVSQSIGIDFLQTQVSGMGGGAAWFDYDNDGDEDLYLTGGMTMDRLYRNNGDGTFTDVSMEAGLAITADYYTSAVVTGDINNDGYREIFVSTWFFNQNPSSIRRNLFFRNIGNGTFSEIGIFSNFAEFSRTMGAAFLDYDNDGFLDLYVINYVNETGLLYDSLGNTNGFDHTCFVNYFYRNNGNLTFTEIGSEVGLDDVGCALAVATTDINNDGNTDIYIANDFGQWLPPNALFANDPALAVFQNIGPETGADIGLFGMGIAVGDYDHDRDLDFYITNLGRNVLLQNDGTGTFSDVTTFAGVENTNGPDGKLATGWGTAFIDYDNDTYEDLFVANGWIFAAQFIATSWEDPNKLYHNNGDGTFTDISDQAGFNDPAKNRGLAFADYDDDGDVDVVVTTLSVGSSVPAKHRFYRNEIDNNHNWLKVKLTGVDCNRDAIGAQLRLFHDELMLIREVRGGSSHASQNTSYIHFGLGEITVIDSLRIDWPGGDGQTIYDVPVNETLYVTQGEDPTVRITFNVDLSEAGADPAGVFLAGDANFRFYADQALSDEDGDGVYQVSIVRPMGFSGYYTFANGVCPDGSCREDLTGLLCGDPAAGNLRYLDNITEDTVIDLCFGSCEACMTTGTDRQTAGFTIALLPNLASRQSTLLFAGAPALPRQVEVLNVNGQAVWSARVDAFDATLELPVYTFTDGLYFVRVRIGGGVATRKLVVQR